MRSTCGHADRQKSGDKRIEGLLEQEIEKTYVWHLTYQA